MNMDVKITEFMKAKIDLSVSIQNLTQLSQIFLQTVEIPLDIMLGSKLNKLKMAIETADLLVNSLNDIFCENEIAKINYKSEDPIKEKVDTWKSNISEETNIKSEKPSEEVVSWSGNIQNEPIEEAVDDWPIATTEDSIKNEPAEENTYTWPNVPSHFMSYHLLKYEEVRNHSPPKTEDEEVSNKTAKLSYICDICNKTLSGKSELTRHIRRVHLGEKEKGPIHTCDQCGYKSVKKSNLQRHKESVHEGVKYFCELCNFHATRPDNMKIHFRAIHENNKMALEYLQ